MISEMTKLLTTQRRASLTLKGSEISERRWEVKRHPEPADENRSLFSVDHCRGVKRLFLHLKLIGIVLGFKSTQIFSRT